MFKKRILCYRKNIRMDSMVSFIEDIECVDDNIENNTDIEKIFENLYARKMKAIENARRCTTTLLFAKKQIDGDNSIFIIGYMFNPINDLNDSTITIKKYKVEYSDLIEIRSTLSIPGFYGGAASRYMIKRCI